MGSLPRCLRRQRAKLPSHEVPSIVLSISIEKIEAFAAENPEMDFWDDVDTLLPAWNVFWCEVQYPAKDGAPAFAMASLNKIIDGQWIADGYASMGDGKALSDVDMGEVFKKEPSDFSDPVLLEIARNSAIMLSMVLYYAHQAAADKPKLQAPLTEWVAPAEDLSAFKTFARKGETRSYSKLSDMEFARAIAEPAPDDRAAPGSGTPKREHEVRGHWRTYRSGRRVWIKNHKRGDPELGRVTRIIDIGA